MYALFKIIDRILDLYLLVLVGSAIFSWLYAFNIVNPQSAFIRAIAQFFYAATEPVLRPIRRILPNFGSIDISPMVVFLIIMLLQNILWTVIYPAFA